MASDFYVYVYIDPRNFEEFYYGKGKGGRKSTHLSDTSDSEKVRRIKSIQSVGLSPIIKVIAKGLTENEALLIEKTLLWKLGKNLTNKSTGHFAEKFRPHDTFHQDLAGFDFTNGIFYVNVGEGEHRCWEDCRKYHFLSAGQDKKWSDQIRTLQKGDIVVPYLKNHGFVGVGRIVEKAKPVVEFRHKGKSLLNYPLKRKSIFHNHDSSKTEYLIKVEWLRAFSTENAKWKKKSGLFTTQLVKASLQGQPKTLEFIQNEFDINIITLLKQS